jgi:hypothetical protein
VTNDRDVTLGGGVKHDADWIYIAFEMTDDRLYGIDSPRHGERGRAGPCSQMNPHQGAGTRTTNELGQSTWRPET